MKWLLCPATQAAWDVHPRRLRNKEFGDGAGKRLADFMPTIRLRSVILLKGEEKKISVVVVHNITSCYRFPSNKESSRSGVVVTYSFANGNLGNNVT